MWSLSNYTVAKVLDYNMVYNDNINGSAAEANYTVANKFRKLVLYIIGKLRIFSFQQYAHVKICRAFQILYKQLNNAKNVSCHFSHLHSIAYTQLVCLSVAHR